MSTETFKHSSPLQKADEDNSTPGFRDVMAQLGAAVHIVTTDGSHGRAGFAASAVCSVTDTPATMLVCLQHTSSAYAAVRANGVLCINTLEIEHESLSKVFGGKTPMAQRFESAQWSVLATGAPVLVGARISLDCRISRIVDVGTHDVLFCQVQAMTSRNQGVGGLYYVDRSYHALAANRVERIAQTANMQHTDGG